MKVILILLILMILLKYSLSHVKQQENFYLIKVFLYFIMSSIHSIFIDFPFPLGALISILIYMHTALNRQGKRFAIIMGLIGFTLTAIPTYQILRPIKQFYLYVKTNDIQEIEVNSMNLESEEKLLQRISDPHLLSQYIHLIQKATAIDHPPYLYHPYENMIFLHCKLSSMDTNIYIQKNIHGEETLYLGSNWVPYEVKGLYDTIFSDRPSEAQKLLIKDHKNNGSTITDGTIINSLWSILPWLTPVQPTGIDMNLQIVFEFSNDTYINGSISSDFTFLSINNEIYQLPYYLSNDLHKQYLLNRLTQVPIDIKQNQNISKEHAHTTVESDDFIFSIDPIIDSLGYGIYKTNKMNKKKELIFPLPTNDISMELIRDQYLLLYIESARNIGDILLVKTSDPYFKRYIENKKNILPDSFEISPDGQKVAYLLREGDHISLKILKDIFREPKELLNGNITQIKWMSPYLIALVNTLDTENRLLLYDIRTNYISYINSFHSIKLMKSNNNKLVFAIYDIVDHTTYTGTYEVDEHMNITQIK